MPFVNVVSCYSVKSCCKVINKKPHLCGGVRVQQEYLSKAPTISPSMLRAFNNNSASAPLWVHHFLLRSSLTDIINTALRLKYFSMFEISQFCSSLILNIFFLPRPQQANNMDVSIIIAAFCGANLVYDESNYDYLWIDAFLTDFYSFKIGLPTDESSTVRLHLFECIIESDCV